MNYLLNENERSVKKVDIELHFEIGRYINENICGICVEQNLPKILKILYIIYNEIVCSLYSGVSLVCSFLLMFLQEAVTANGIYYRHLITNCFSLN